jgi:hypothetical protein
VQPIEIAAEGVEVSGAETQGRRGTAGGAHGTGARTPRR